MDAGSPLPLDQSGRLMRLATYASVSVAGVLIAIKLAAWLMTDSVSLLSTLIDSLLDAAASLVNLLAVRHALQPADREHRFGHGKAEPLAGLAQAAFIAGSAVFLVLQAGERLFHPQPVVNSQIGYAVMGISIGLTLVLVLFQRWVVRRTASMAISADSLHYQSDLLVNLGVIGSLFLAAEMGWSLADPLFALAIAFYILKGAREIGNACFNALMDKELPDEDRARIKTITRGVAGVLDVHDLRTRSSGPYTFIQIHVEMEPTLTLKQAHDIADNVIGALEAAFANAEVLVHQDPKGIEEPRAAFE